MFPHATTSYFVRRSSVYKRIPTFCNSFTSNSKNEILSLKAALSEYTPYKSAKKECKESSNSFVTLGLSDDIARSLLDKNITIPTPVQQIVIPLLLQRENVMLAASTGSGKTLAYTLPVMQLMHLQEHGLSATAAANSTATKGGDASAVPPYVRLPKKPRCLVLVPTRELARQVLSTVKHVSHFMKTSATAVLGGEPYSLQKKNLDKLIDIVVASPGRLLQHHKQGNVYLSQVSHIIIDEVDTMLTQGFGSDIREIIQASSVLRNGHNKDLDESVAVSQKKLQLIMASATLTKAVKALLEDVKSFDVTNVAAKRNHPGTKSDNGASGTIGSIKIVELEGLHRSLPSVSHCVEEVRSGADKQELLRDILERHKNKNFRTLIFCNTVTSCQALQYYLNGVFFGSGDSTFGQANVVDHKGRQQVTLTYHGDLNSKEREANLQSFRNGDSQFLVCTDIAARGLDIPEIDHVIMFDYPLNPIDYLHRSGRCGRAGRKGLVTALVAKRDVVLSRAVTAAIARDLPLDKLSSSKADYEPGGRLFDLVRGSVQSHGDSGNQYQARAVAAAAAAADRSSNSALVRVGSKPRRSGGGPSSRSGMTFPDASGGTFHRSEHAAFFEDGNGSGGGRGGGRGSSKIRSGAGTGAGGGVSRSSVDGGRAGFVRTAAAGTAATQGSPYARRNSHSKEDNASRGGGGGGGYGNDLGAVLDALEGKTDRQYGGNGGMVTGSGGRLVPPLPKQVSRGMVRSPRTSSSSSSSSSSYRSSSKDPVGRRSVGGAAAVRRGSGGRGVGRGRSGGGGGSSGGGGGGGAYVRRIGATAADATTSRGRGGKSSSRSSSASSGSGSGGRSRSSDDTRASAARGGRGGARGGITTRGNIIGASVGKSRGVGRGSGGSAGAAGGSYKVASGAGRRNNERGRAGSETSGGSSGSTGRVRGSGGGSDRSSGGSGGAGLGRTRRSLRSSMALRTKVRATTAARSGRGTGTGGRDSKGPK